MIEVQKNYKITLTEEQARKLFTLLQLNWDTGKIGGGGLYDELQELRNQLKKIFAVEIR